MESSIRGVIRPVDIVRKKADPNGLAFNIHKFLAVLEVLPGQCGRDYQLRIFLKSYSSGFGT